MEHPYVKNALVKVTLPHKNPYIGFVMNADIKDGEVTGVFVGYLCRLNGKTHPDYGKWRCFTTDKLEVVDTSTADGKKWDRVMRELHKV